MRSRLNNFLWTKTACEQLMDLWENSELTASQIAERIDRRLTKNSVIGKAHRLGLKLRYPQRTPRIRMTKKYLPVTKELPKPRRSATSTEQRIREILEKHL